MIEQNQLLIIPPADPTKLFDPSSMDAILDEIKTTAKSFQLDVTTPAGRKEIASVAHKVAKTKTAIDESGKNLVSGIKAEAAKIDAERKKARDFLDALKAEIRQPLTDFENAEKERVSGIEARIAEINALREEIPGDSAGINSRIAIAEAFNPGELAEFATQAEGAKTVTLRVLNHTLESVKQREAEAAELEKLRREAAEREQKEREEAIRREAEEKAKREAAEAAEREKREAEEKHRRELAEKEAQAKAREDAIRQEVERKERERIEAEEKRKAEEKAAAEAQAARIADEKHRAKIATEAVNALKERGLSEQDARIAVGSIEAGEIPHITIKY